MKVRYDPQVDAMYVRIRAGRVIDSEEIEPGVVVDYDKNDRVVGVEILRVSRRLRVGHRSKSLKSPIIRKASA